jgi:hypothetical protein
VRFCRVRKSMTDLQQPARLKQKQRFDTCADGPKA